MAYKQFGDVSGLVEQPDWNITNNGRGLLEGVAIFKLSHSGQDAPNIPVARLSAHPNDSRLTCWDVETTYGKNGLATCTAKYVGIANGIMTDPEWTMSGAASEQSIRFHPKFDEWVAMANKEKTKIRLDEQGYFVSFGPKHPKVPAVEQFVAPSGSCKVSFYTKSKELWYKKSIGGLGKWTNIPSYGPSYLNASVAKLSWLLTSTSVNEYANIFKVDLDFTLSVLGKPHNVDMYEQLT
jgi:hypothetical protein